MSNLELSPQPDRPATGTFAPRSRAEILDRYRKLRAISVTHNSGAMNRLTHDALIEQARRLGIVRGRTLLLNTADELSLVSDLLVHARHPGRKRPLDRYASSQRFSPGSEEALVLDAMVAARFAILRVKARHPEAGLIMTDAIREEEFWLVDEGMEQSAPNGYSMATRVFSPQDFHMTAGVAIPLTRPLLASALASTPVLGRMAMREAVDDRRFAEALYREAMRSGATERVRFQELPGPGGDGG
jgi:hypothetical protein